MRRFLAMLLLAAFGLPVVAPALTLAQDAGPHLPACCRRHGAHQCAMNLGKPTSAPAFTKLCLHFPQPSATSPANASAAFASPAPLDLLHVLTLPATQRADIQRRISRERSRHKRGPPAISI